MKTRKIYGIILILLVFAFPFKYAYITPTNSNTINLLCFLAVVIGTLIFMGMTFSDNKK